MRMRERLDREELLDAGGVPDQEVRRSLGDLERMHRWLGGGSAIRRFLEPRLCAGARILDIGCGSGLLEAEITRWAQKRKQPARVTGLDQSPLHLSIARERGRLPSAVAADALRLPFADSSFDFVVTTLVLHHFSPEDLQSALAEMARVCRGRVIAYDLIRDWLPAIAFRAATPVFATSWVTRHDGWASLRRAYTPEEWRKLVAELGWQGARVVHHRLVHRMTLVYDVD